MFNMKKYFAIVCLFVNSIAMSVQAHENSNDDKELLGQYNSFYRPNLFECYAINQGADGCFNTTPVEAMMDAVTHLIGTDLVVGQSYIIELSDTTVEQLLNSLSCNEKKFDTEIYDYSVAIAEVNLSNDYTFDIEDFSCLNGFFAKDDHYAIDMDDPFEFYTEKGLEADLISDIEELDQVNYLVCAKRSSHYFNDGSTYNKITIFPDYSKNIAYVFTETWTTKNPSYMTMLNGLIASSIAALAYVYATN